MTLLLNKTFSLVSALFTGGIDSKSLSPFIPTRQRILWSFTPRKWGVKKLEPKKHYQRTITLLLKKMYSRISALITCGIDSKPLCPFILSLWRGLYSFTLRKWGVRNWHQKNCLADYNFAFEKKCFRVFQRCLLAESIHNRWVPLYQHGKEYCEVSCRENEA